MIGAKVLADIAMAGVEKANREYEKISDGWWITDSGVEGFTAGYVAKSFHRNGKFHVGIEMNAKRIISDSKASNVPGIMPGKIDGLKRIDIAAYRGNTPVLVCEVKKISGFGLIDKDIQRIAHILKRGGKTYGGSIKSGMFVGYFMNKLKVNGKNMDNKFLTFEYNVKKLCSKIGINSDIYNVTSTTPMHPSYNLWCCCVVMSDG